MADVWNGPSNVAPFASHSMGECSRGSIRLGGGD